MFQKVNPHRMRVGVIKDWDSRWYPNASLEEVKQHKQPVAMKSGKIKSVISVKGKTGEQQVATKIGKIKPWDTRNFFQKSRKRKKKKC